MIPHAALSSLLVGLLFVAAGTSDRRPSAGRSDARRLPPTMLWAWHGQHDLRFLDAETHGVAFLAGTVRSSGGSVSLRAGVDRIDTRPGTTLLAVVRIEIDPEASAGLDERTVEEVVAGVLGFDDAGSFGLQVDFDATLSQRPFYARLLTELRRALERRFLSVTALPSWCLDDEWLPVERIDELVPMVYRMGRDAPIVRRRLAGGRDFAPDCRAALGISTDEPVPALDASGRRLYVFSSERWTAGLLERTMARVRRGPE